MRTREKENKLVQYALQYMNKKKNTKKKVIEIEQESKALYLFSHDNWLRLKLKIMLENPYFEGFIYHVIAFNSLLLALDEPIIDPVEKEMKVFDKSTTDVLLNIVSAIFVVEFLIKIVVYGFCIGPKTYIKDNFNKLDFIIVCFSILNWTLEAVT